MGKDPSVDERSTPNGGSGTEMIEDDIKGE